MKSFLYTVKDEIGLHARPAGLLSQTAKEFKSEIIIKKDSKEVNATRLMMLMSMGIKNGDTVEVRASGEDEERAIEAMKKFFEENL